MLELAFPPNPDFGAGATRRRIHLRFADGYVVGKLSDVFHEMECTVTHDEKAVTAIDGRMIRIPNTACPLAPTKLADLIGTPIGIDAPAFYATDLIRSHCTHLFDLAFMVIAHAGCSKDALVFEAVVPDSPEPATTTTVEGWLNGIKQISWSIRDELIVAPGELAGKPVCKGFSRWAFSYFDPGQLMLPLLISRTCLLARGRAYRIDAFPGEPITRIGGIQGACFAYSPEHIDDARFVAGSVRDFSLGVTENS